jgi:L-asparagine oxygenase
MHSMNVELTLSDEVAGELERLASKLPPYSPADYGTFMAQCRQAAACANPVVKSWAQQVRIGHVGLLRNLPVGRDLPSTPAVKAAADAVPMFADCVIGLLAALFGDIVTFEGKVTERHIHNVYPAKNEEFSQLGASADELDWHVEDGFHPQRAEWLGILCLRSDPSVITWVARARDLEFCKKDWTCLRSEAAEVRVDESFAPGLRGLLFSVCTVSGPEDDPEITFDPQYTRLRDRHQQELVQRVRRAANRAKWAVELRVGDFLILNNRRTVHARSAHEPRMDGTDRWIKRTMISDCRETRNMAAPGLVCFPELVVVEACGKK